MLVLIIIDASIEIHLTLNLMKTLYLQRSNSGHCNIAQGMLEIIVLSCIYLVSPPAEIHEMRRRQIHSANFQPNGTEGREHTFVRAKCAGSSNLRSACSLSVLLHL